VVDVHIPVLVFNFVVSVRNFDITLYSASVDTPCRSFKLPIKLITAVTRCSCYLETDRMQCNMGYSLPTCRPFLLSEI